MSWSFTFLACVRARYLGGEGTRDSSSSRILPAGPAKKRVQFWIYLDPLKTASETFPCKQKVDPVPYTDMALDFVYWGPRIDRSSP